MTLRKNIKWRRGKEVNENLGKKIMIKSQGMGKNIKLQGTIYTPDQNNASYPSAQQSSNRAVYSHNEKETKKNSHNRNKNVI